MHPKDSPLDLALQARQIAKSGMPPRAAWSELKSWASGKGPLALRSAAMEFISVYGRSPEAQLLMPEVMRSSSGFAPFPQRPSLFGFSPHVKPDLKMAQPGINIEPKFTAKAPLEKIQMKTSLELPKRPELSEPLHFDASKSPDTRVLSASKGHGIMHSLIHKIRSHASEHVPHIAPKESKPASRKRKSKKKIAPPKSARPGKRKPARRKSSAKKRRT
jgi:hypothetical protein